MSTDTHKDKEPAAKKDGFSAEEKAAMKARAQELKAAARMDKDRASGEAAVQAALKAMSASDRAIGERLHALIGQSAPELSPKTWYGMPAYAKDGKVVCYFRDAAKFKERYAMFGFNDRANLDEGTVWPVAYAIQKLTAADEDRIAALVKRAVS